MLWWQLCNDPEINAVSLEMGTISFSGGIRIQVPPLPGKCSSHHIILSGIFCLILLQLNHFVAFVRRYAVSIDRIDSTPTQITG